jgi:hypothetical protein
MVSNFAAFMVENKRGSFQHEKKLFIFHMHCISALYFAGRRINISFNYTLWSAPRFPRCALSLRFSG